MESKRLIACIKYVLGVDIGMKRLLLATTQHKVRGLLQHVPVLGAAYNEGMRSLIVMVWLLLPLAAQGAVEVFAKGALSRNYISRDSWTISVSATTGIGLQIFPGVKLEGRYTNISALQNTLEVPASSTTITLSDFKTQTVIYSLGLDIDFLGETSPVQPFIFIGMGYIETERSYYWSETGSTQAQYAKEPKQLGVTGNLGLGIRIRIVRSLALELEGYAYGMNINKPNPLIDMYFNAGIRLFL